MIRKRQRPRRHFLVLVAVDPSREAHAALAGATVFPWPAGSHGVGLVARRTPATRGRPRYVLESFDRAFRRTAAHAERVLKTRWPEADVSVVDEAPAEAIIANARRRHCEVIILGSRHRGWLVKRLLGSVATAVVRHAPCSTLVVRGRPRQFTSVVLGVDGSPHARRAVAMLARLQSRGRRVTVVRAIEPIAAPAMPLMPRGARSLILRELQAANTVARREAEHELRRYERRLQQAGWKTRAEVITDHAVRGLLTTARKTHADLIVAGARGVGGIARLLLGSVSEGILDRSPISVFIVR